MMANNTSHLSSDCASYSPVAINRAVACLFILLFPVALVLNGVAAWVSLHLHSTSTFIVCLKNLVAADLLMTLMLPLKAATMLPEATVELRAFACRYSDVIFFCSLYTSISLMGLISLDRFFKIVGPCGKLQGQNVVFSQVMSTLVWVVIFCSTAFPTMILTDRDLVDATANCMSMKGPAGVMLHKWVVSFMEGLFWLISALVVFCYIGITMKVLQSFRNSGSNNSKGKKKTKLRVFLILAVFFVCFAPLHIMRIPFTIYEIHNINMCTEVWMDTLHKLAVWVSAINSCLDPFLYSYLCKEYRNKLVGMMKAHKICVGLYSGENEDDSQ